MKSQTLRINFTLTLGIATRTKDGLELFLFYVRRIQHVLLSHLNVRLCMSLEECSLLSPSGEEGVEWKKKIRLIN